MSRVVVDASAIVAVILPDEHGPLASLVLATLEQSTIDAPAHWPVEIANSVLSARRRRRLDDKDWASAAAKTDAIVAAASIHPPNRASALLPLALEHGLTAYDAAYVDLAQRLDCAVLTGDGDMKRAARALGLQVLES